MGKGSHVYSSQKNLELLAKRFDARAKMLRNHAANIRWSNYTSAFADQIEAAETAYRICANEVRMACAGNLEIVKEVMNENKTAGRA